MRDARYQTFFFSKLRVPDDVSETNIDCRVADVARIVLVGNKVGAGWVDPYYVKWFVILIELQKDPRDLECPTRCAHTFTCREPKADWNERIQSIGRAGWSSPVAKTFTEP